MELKNYLEKLRIKVQEQLEIWDQYKEKSATEEETKVLPKSKNWPRAQV
jgi:hypothetical protein